MFRLQSITLLSLLASIFHNARGFTTYSGNTRFGITTSLNVGGSFWDPLGLSDKYYTLDEREDKEETESEVLLRQNYVAVLGESNGPLTLESAGSWELIEEKFKMTLTRTFETGREKSDDTDVGEFTFDVVRTYTGSVTKVGEKIAVEGIIHLVDEVLGDKEVGYFSLIDTTEERLSLSE